MLDLLAAGRKVVDVAQDLEVSDQTVYNWRRQDRIDRGLLPGRTTSENAELVWAKKRIAALEAGLAATKTGDGAGPEWSAPKSPVCGDQVDGR